jgi:regulator of replication initiation timing
MSKSKKTKAQVLQEFEDLQQRFDTLTKSNSKLQNELSSAAKQADLGRELSATKKNLAVREREVQGLKRDAEEAKERLSASQKENDALKKRIKTETEKSTARRKADESGKATFRLEVYEAGDELAAKATHTLSGEQIPVDLMPGTLHEFVARHVGSQLSTKKTIPAGPEHQRKTDLDAPLQLARKLLNEVQITSAQPDTENKLMQRAGDPLELNALLSMPKMPTPHNLGVDKDSVVIRVLAKERGKAEPVLDVMEAAQITPGKMALEKKISLGSLEQGTYSLQVISFAPFADVQESQMLDVRVV